MSLPGGGSGWHFVQIGSQPANQPASCNWPANQQCEKMSTCQTLGWSDRYCGGRTGGPTTLGLQSRVQALPLVPLGGVTYLTKARKGTEMSSAALYIPVPLLSGTVCSFVSTWPNHIFLYQMYINAIRTVFLSRPIYSYPSTINLMYYYMPRYFFLGTTFIITNWKSYGKKSDQMSTWPEASSGGYI